MSSLRSRRSTAVALVCLATFTDLLAYSIAVPVLPDLSARLGASPTVIGLLFSSFGLTMLLVSIPMGTVSDRIGRRAPMVLGLIVLAGSSVLFAFADSLAWLFAARMAQGVADAITWVVGLALIADLYGPQERGRITGLVMAGPGLAFMLGPSIGGWLYELGGIRLPFLAVAALCAIVLLGFLCLFVSAPQRGSAPTTLAAAIRVPDIVTCVAVVVTAAGTIAMLEPVVVLHLERFGVHPGRVGILFGVAAVVTATLNPLFGRLADRSGAWRLMLLGLLLSALVLPILGRASSFGSAIVWYTLEAAAISLVITPSLSFMAAASPAAGGESFGLAYGLYNVGWGIGLLAGPAAGGFLFEQLGFGRLTLLWAPAMVIVTAVLARTRAPRRTPAL
jgi:DHA1 family solute carrier family 18 vesicular amine transporter 1/2